MSTASSLFDPDRSAERLPVSLITGFLGSGKTTLLNRLLRRPEMADSAVVINEFGEVALDHLLVEPVTGEAVVLASGCVCCAVRGDLQDALLEERAAPLRVVRIAPHQEIGSFICSDISDLSFGAGAVLTDLFLRIWHSHRLFAKLELPDPLGERFSKQLHLTSRRRVRLARDV
jgi:CobW/HypB/UreG, nucleotide-binding domain